jgi:hypothetical protein
MEWLGHIAARSVVCRGVRNSLAISLKQSRPTRQAWIGRIFGLELGQERADLFEPPLDFPRWSAWTHLHIDQQVVNAVVIDHLDADGCSAPREIGDSETNLLVHWHAMLVALPLSAH